MTYQLSSHAPPAIHRYFSLEVAEFSLSAFVDSATGTQDFGPSGAALELRVHSHDCHLDSTHHQRLVSVRSPSPFLLQTQVKLLKNLILGSSMSTPPVEPASAVGGQISREDALAALRSGALRQALNESSKGPVEKAQLLRGLGQRLFTESQSRRNVALLDDAVRLAREALEALPAGHEAITEYADTLVFYAQTKGIVVQGPESTEQYITAIQAATDATSPEGLAHNHFVQRLAWAYWARFESSKSDEDLEHVIDYINGLVDAHHDLLVQTELVLGQAFHSRFSRTKSTEDIERAVELFEKSLKSPKAGQPVRHIFLQKLVQYSVDGLQHTKVKPGLDRLISNAKFAIAELPQSESKERIESLLSKAETSRELLEQGPLLHSIFKEVGDLKLDDKNGPKPIGKTYVPRVLYDRCTIGSTEIRTLEVMPGKPDQDIICKLHSIALADKVDYEVGHIYQIRW